MKTLVFVAQKGGTGKSTLAVMCAVAAVEVGNKIVLIDMDPQESVAQWSDGREEEAPDVFILKPDELPAAISRLQSSGYDYALVDTAGVDSAATRAAMREADMCIIPTRPAPQDLRALRPTHRAVVQLDKNFAFVLNQTGPRLFQRYREAVSGLESIASVARPLIVQRNDHQDAFGASMGVTEFNPTGKAADEIRALWQWISQRVRKDGNE